MTRQRIEIERAGLRSPRERMWAAMRAAATFSALQIEDKAHPISLLAVYSYMEGLFKAGYIEPIELRSRGDFGHFKKSVFRVVKSAAITPQLDREGQPVVANLGVLAMWRAMKIRRTFNALEVATDATQGNVVCSLATAKSYI